MICLDGLQTGQGVFCVRRGEGILEGTCVFASLRMLYLKAGRELDATCEVCRGGSWFSFAEQLSGYIDIVLFSESMRSTLRRSMSAVYIRVYVSTMHQKTINTLLCASMVRLLKLSTAVPSGREVYGH